MLTSSKSITYLDTNNQKLHIQKPILRSQLLVLISNSWLLTEWIFATGDERGFCLLIYYLYVRVSLLFIEEVKFF